MFVEATASLRGEIVPLSEIGRVSRAAWAELATAVSEPNPFLRPDFLQALAPLCARRNAGVALVWEDAPRPRLVALLACARVPGIPGLGPSRIASLAHTYLPNATPLLAADRAESAASLLLATLAARWPARMLALGDLRADGPAAAAFVAAATAQGLACHRGEPAHRAAIRGGGTHISPAAQLSGRRLRELRRCERKLAAEGEVSAWTVRGAQAAQAVSDFLALEAAGWKGAQRSALAANERSLAFARAALSGDDVEADVLALDGRAIAVTVMLRAGNEIAAFKTAYDERYRSFSPGSLLHLRTLERVAADGSLALLDSCAVPGNPVETLWTDRIAMGDLLIALDPRLDAGALADAAERRERRARALGTLKRLAKRVLGHRTTASRGM